LALALRSKSLLRLVKMQIDLCKDCSMKVLAEALGQADCDLWPIDAPNLRFSTRTVNGLRTAGITHLGQLRYISPSALSKTHNFGRVSLEEVREVLTNLGIWARR
jgi:DNA-directed RNA polymerase alpha subunit